ncbi:MAG: methyltransferase domain-containing protein [Patescibacteria group bacterium]
MKNILKQDPTIPVHGRAKRNLTFVSDSSIKNKDILDIGCGYGWFELNALKKGCKHITGIEITKTDLATAKKCIKDSRAAFKIGSAIELPFEDSSFDTVVCWEVLEHIPKNTESQLFAEAYRVLRSGGAFYLSTPLHSISTYLDPAWWLIGHRHYKPSKVKNFAKKAGFAIKKVETGGGFWEIVNINSILICKWIFRREPFFWDFINKKRDQEYKGKGIISIFLRAKKP